MNLHQMARGLINAVNPYTVGQIKVCVGYEIVNFKQIPSYKEITSVSVQIQPISQETIAHIEGLNLQGIQASVYCNGHFSAINRPKGKGNDLFIYQGKTWLIAKVVEWWPDWCHFVVTEQLDETIKQIQSEQ